MWITPMNDTTKLTVELREIVESGVDIWDFEYPSFYTGDDKKAFEKKVIDHYYFRQIGQETVGRFLHCFRSRINDIMPYYIQLYESEKFMRDIEDPFATVDYTETFEQETSGTTSGTSVIDSESNSDGTSNGNSTRKFSNTPQGSIDNLDSYLTEANVDTSGMNTTDTTNATTTTETSGSDTGTVRHTLTKKGAMGVTTFGHDMIEYRQSFLNIDLMLIKELNDLFLGIY